MALLSPPAYVPFPTHLFYHERAEKSVFEDKTLKAFWLSFFGESRGGRRLRSELLGRITL